MEDGTRVLLLAYADDLAFVTSSQTEMQDMMDSLCDFLKFHGVTLSADDKVSLSKTKYISHNPNAKKGDEIPRIKISCFNRDSRPGDIKRPKNIVLKSLGKSYIFIYLGGRLSLDLNWTKITQKSQKGISRELNRLKKKQLTLSAAEAVASSVILGKAGYLLQLAQFPLSRLKAWDTALNHALRYKVKGAPSASPAMLHADKKKGGLGIYSFSALALQSGATELLVRLNSSGIAGQVARCRFKAALRSCPHWHRADGTIPASTKTNFSLYTILRLRRLGYTLIGPDNSALVQEHFRRSTRLCDYLSAYPALLVELEEKGFSLVEDLFSRETGIWKIRPWLQVRLTHHDEPCAWYRSLMEVKDHIVAVGFEDSRLEPHQYGRLPPEDTDSDSSRDSLGSSYDDSDGPPETETLRIAPLSPPASRGLDHSSKGIQLRSLYCKLTVSKRRLLEDNSAPIDGSPAGIERRKLRWKQIQLLKQVTAGLASVEGAIASPEGYDDSIQAIYALDTPIQALLPAHPGAAQPEDSQGVYTNDEVNSEPAAHVQTQEVHIGGTLSDSDDTNMHLSYLSLYDVNCPFSQNDLPLKST